MAIDGHAPTRGVAHVWYLLGQGVCPQCREDHYTVYATPGLEPTDTGKYRCPDCEAVYPVANVDGRGKHPKVSLPGVIQAARSSAPDDASDKEIQNVAWVAHERGCDPADVWANKRNRDLGEWGGDTGR